MKQLVVLISLFICSIALGNNGDEGTFTRYTKGKQGETNWQELKYFKNGNRIKVAYNDTKQKSETSMIIAAFWNDTEEKAIKMRVRFTADSKDLYLLKIYQTSDKGYATLEKIEGNLLYPYFRRLDEQKTKKD